MKTLGILLVVLLTTKVTVAGPSVTAKENFETLLAKRSCRNCDLAALNFNRMDLSGVDLEGADLSLSKFFLTNLAGANLKNAKLNGAQFGGADLGDADLRGADLRGASIDSAYLGGAKLTGKLITTTPYEDEGITEVEKEVYVEDQTIPKKTPAPGEVKVGERRDLGEAPPVLSQTQKRRVEDSVQEPSELQRPAAPEVKSVTPVKPLVIKHEEKKESISTASLKIEKKAAPDVKVVKTAKPEKRSSPVKTGVSEKPGQSSITVDESAEIIEKDLKVEKKRLNVAKEPVDKVADKPAFQPEVNVAKEKMDNLEKLLDKNRCYGCDLSGLDLSGKNLDGADLERANLSGTNLTKADLEGANLKGANLRGAILVNADLEDADLYKADLRDADLSGAKQKNAQFDNAIMDGAVGTSGGSMMLSN